MTGQVTEVNVWNAFGTHVKKLHDIHINRQNKDSLVPPWSVRADTSGRVNFVVGNSLQCLFATTKSNKQRISASAESASACALTAVADDSAAAECFSVPNMRY